ncbi:type II restriction endonuclease, partial [Sphaerospermopsis sp. FACHB-1094]|nr:type II restriction endonuclease [Sphaerospermopsis sp. FACHB-1094]
MNFHKIQPRESLNKAFLKVKPNRNDIENFKKNLQNLIDKINESESEEFHKNLIGDFLKNTYYSNNHFINTKGRNDLVIHNGKDAKTTVGVILEFKKPTNKSEMLKVDNLNTKALQELVLYFLRERLTAKNLEIKYLIATNIYEWFIFDANIFEKAFIENKTLVQQFTDFEAGRLSNKKTDFFYKEIAKPTIDEIVDKITFTHLDIRDYQQYLNPGEHPDEHKLISLFKLFSPEHLLKLPFTNDSNTLDKGFYSELLHIIGLVETKEGSKKLIQRKKEPERNVGSLIENAIIQLDSLDKISRLEKPEQFGETYQEQLFNLGLELAITWINRILFLKLLEAQLIRYHKNDPSWGFLNLQKVKNYDDLNSLFFSVLARKPQERSQKLQTIFAHVPYLNSSLFELTDLEQDTIVISNLGNEKLPIFTGTILKDNNGKKLTGEINALEYLFEFLNAYDFSSETGEEIQEENKRLINAAVLGLIFEKINGYKDGSFFTPGFITM